MEKLKQTIKWIRTDGLLHFLVCEEYKKKQEEEFEGFVTE